METHDHGFSTHPFRTWRFSFRTLACSIATGVILAMNIYATASVEYHSLFPSQGRRENSTGGRSSDATVAGGAIDPDPGKVLNQTAGSLADSSPKGNAGHTGAAPGSSNGTVASQIERKKPESLPTTTKQASAPSEGGSANGDPPTALKQKESRGSKAKDMRENTLSVAERVRRRFHSQKLFQDEGDNDSGEDPGPSPEATMREVVQEPPEENFRADSRTKLVCLSNCSMHGGLKSRARIGIQQRNLFY